MENIEVGRQQGLQLLNGEIVQPVPSQLAYFVHVCGAEGAEGKQAVCHQCLVAAGEESTWVVEPLQGGARGYQVGFSGEVDGFGITGDELHGSAVAKFLDALFHFPAQVVQQQGFRLQGVEEDTRVASRSAAKLYDTAETCVWFLYELHHLLGDLLLHAGLPGIGIPGFGKAGGYQLFVHRVQWLVHRSCR